jgi:hypothetical protein
MKERVKISLYLEEYSVIWRELEMKHGRKMSYVAVVA